jgi:hypothetical protein
MYTNYNFSFKRLITYLSTRVVGFKTATTVSLGKNFRTNNRVGDYLRFLDFSVYLSRFFTPENYTKARFYYKIGLFNYILHFDPSIPGIRKKSVKGIESDFYI